MEINLHITPSIASKSESSELQAILSNALESFQQHIRHVSLTIEDINGPRRGIDKQCRCVLHLKRMAPIVIVDQDANLGVLMHRVADRAAQNLSQRNDQKFKRSRQNVSMAGARDRHQDGDQPDSERMIEELSSPDWLLPGEESPSTDSPWAGRSTSQRGTEH